MLLRFVWNNIKAKLLRNILVTISVCVSVTLIMLVLNTGYQINDSFVQGTSQYDLVIGYKGSDTQLVLNSLFYFDAPEGNIPFEAYTELQGDSRIRRIVPLAMGDNVHGFKVVGTNDDFFSEFGEPSQGTLLGEYSNGNPVIVLGYNAAKKLDLTVGDQISGAHGVNEIDSDEEDEHGHSSFQYTVIGILNRANTPDDNAVFTHYQSVWEVHEHDEDDGHDADEDEDEHSKEITAILIQSISFASSQMLLTDPMLKNNSYKIVSTNATLRNVLSIFGSAQSAMIAILVIVVIISFNMMFLAMFTAASERQKDFAILRALGSNKTRIFATIVLEALIISLIGVLGGFILSHLGIQIISNFITGLFGIKIKFYKVYIQELIVALAAIALGIIAALIPASGVYRTEPSKYLH